MKFSNNNDDRQLIDELKSVGAVLRDENDAHRESLRDRLQESVPQHENRKQGFRFPKLGFVLVPTLSAAAIAVLAIVSAAYRPTYHIAEPYVIDDMGIESASSMVYPDIELLDATSFSGEIGLSSQTFKSRFLKNIGRHDVPQDRVNEYRETNGDFFEQDARFNILSKEKDALSEVTDIFTRLDGNSEK